MKQDEYNPYQAPATEEPMSVDSDITRNAYADGEDLLLKTGFISPRICAISGEPLPSSASTTLLELDKMKKNNFFRELLKTSPYFLLIVFFSVSNNLGHGYFLAIIIMMAITSIFSIWNTFRSKPIPNTANFYFNNEIKMISKVKILFCIGILIAIFYFLEFDFANLSPTYFLVLFVFATIMGLFTQHHGLHVVSKNDDYFRIRGCHPDFLAQFPVAPFENL